MAVSNVNVAAPRTGQTGPMERVWFMPVLVSTLFSRMLGHSALGLCCLSLSLSWLTSASRALRHRLSSTLGSARSLGIAESAHQPAC